MKFRIYFTSVSNSEYINPECHPVEQATIIVADNKDEALIKFAADFYNDSNIVHVNEILPEEKA